MRELATNMILVVIYFLQCRRNFSGERTFRISSGNVPPSWYKAEERWGKKEISTNGVDDIASLPTFIYLLNQTWQVGERSRAQYPYYIN